MQNDIKFTIYESKTDGSLASIIENLSHLKKKTDEYYGKILSDSTLF